MPEGSTKIFIELPEYTAELVADKKHFISPLKSLIDKSFYSHDKFFNDWILNIRWSLMMFM